MLRTAQPREQTRLRSDDLSLAAAKSEIPAKKSGRNGALDRFLLKAREIAVAALHNQGGDIVVDSLSSFHDVKLNVPVENSLFVV